MEHSELSIPGFEGHAQPPSAADREADRLAALYRLRLLDTSPTPAFDRVTRIAARLMVAPVALFSLVDAHRQWFKACVGLDVCETARDISFCTHVVASQELMVIEDARSDERFRSNPLVTDAPFIRAYVGVPIMTYDFQPIGTLCIVDFVPRKFDPESIHTLIELGRLLEDLVHARELTHYINIHLPLASPPPAR
jgi:GAF domain-containing protein